ncbi:endoplasmic reticulum membrane-associated RNA degradation protein isoform X2 [Ceratitis capitata]|uniref:endoplasmic reticulum membrane-associated RNA degradation protein isoform X2 n=1 Tax=Ceratitis capitata TaxID=7213 RepID=UPI000618945F|nr:endoplasmic reticulum membrane-associated RNA degradation protein isoform X2 [Ceratitis capitata]
MEKSVKCSLISENISKFFVNHQKFNHEETRKYIYSNWCLNFEGLYGDYERYLSCFRKLLPLFEGIHDMYQNTVVDLNSFHLEWLGCNRKYLLDSFSNYTARSSTLELILLISSMLENALGNLYFIVSGKRTPPHLLRDLLRTEELDSIFGMEIISLLIIILGTPHSINLRNIVWHGFPKPREIPDYYASVLIVLLHSMGYELIKKKHIDNMIERPKVKDFKTSCMQVSKQLPLSTEWYDESRCAEQVKDADYLNDDYKEYWYRILQYYKSKEFWKLIMLIIPQIELILRLIYARANDFDVSAKLNEYYIIMDSIFESQVNDAESRRQNSILCSAVKNEDILKCVYDLFIAPKGPRLRDKISHGEVDIAAINNVELCDLLLFLSMGLLRYNFPFPKYESVFHLNSLTKSALCTAKQTLGKLVEKHLPEKYANMLQALSGNKMHNSIHIFNRSTKEPEFILLVFKNSNLVETTCVNYEHSIETRLELLANRELHSKRRRTLERMIATLPGICKALSEILSCLLCIFTKLQNDDLIYDQKEACSSLLRFLKHTLKLNENFVKYSDLSSNEWIKAVELCKKFTDVKSLHYPEQYF